MLNSSTLNYSTLNIDDALAAGTIISFAQNNVTSGSGTLVSISQNAQLYTTGSGNIFKIAQKVEVTGYGNIIALSQNVQVANTYLSRNGYDCDIYINNILINKNTIGENVLIKRSEGNASTCEFTLITSSGVQTPEQYQGLPIFVNITNNNNKVFRVFTGWVDEPTVDLIEKKIKYICSDRRQTQIMKLPYAAVQMIGQYSIDVFGSPQDQYDELTKRLMTTPSSFDFDGSGVPTITPWKPKTSPDFILSGSKMLYDGPTVSYTNRTRTTNTINITVNYKFQRLHQQIANVIWYGYQDFIKDWWSKGQPSFPQRTTIASAASATSWVPVTNIYYVPLWPAGAYTSTSTINGVTIGGVIWQPNKVTNTYAPKTINQPLVSGTGTNPSLIFADGYEHAVPLNVLDSNGNQVYTVTGQTITDTSSQLCRGAQWVAGKKFSQPVTELYTIKMTSPQAISRYGVIDVQESITINDSYDTGLWTNDKTTFNTLSTPGTAVNCVTDSSGYAKGQTIIGITAAGSGSINVGNQITITGDPSGMYYTVTNGISNVGVGGSITIASPGLAGVIPAQQNSINLIPGSSATTTNFFIDKKILYARLVTALSTVVQKGKTTILKAHRDVTVNFKCPIWPDIDLQHTVQTTATAVSCTGKVSSITHSIDIKTGEATTSVSLLLSRSFASDTESTLSVTYPPYEDKSYIGTGFNVALQTHVGINPSLTINPLALTWNGYIGNNNVNNVAAGITTRTTYPESFIVDYPPIPSTLTTNKTITQNPPGVNHGVTTNSAGYASGATSLTLAAVGTGAILQGDSITIAGDSSSQVYVVQNDILDVSGGGTLNISPGLGASLSASTHAVTTASPGNNFIINVPNDSITVTF